ncbi:hypothetical protein D3C84_476000 [compost metagenome]
MVAGQTVDAEQASAPIRFREELAQVVGLRSVGLAAQAAMLDRAVGFLGVVGEQRQALGVQVGSQVLEPAAVALLQAHAVALAAQPAVADRAPFLQRCAATHRQP